MFLLLPRHRSSNASKEKSAPWALAFLKLVNDHDETAVRDGLHDLLVYKIENKKLSSSLGDIGQQIKYLDLPFLKNNQYHLKQKAASALTFLPKDNFVVQTTLCSTKLTQNEGSALKCVFYFSNSPEVISPGLRSLLKWRDDPSKLNENLNIFNQKVNGKEFVKFLPDVLDALFSILTENSDADQYDYKVGHICCLHCGRNLTPSNSFADLQKSYQRYPSDNGRHKIPAIRARSGHVHLGKLQRNTGL